MKKKKVQIRKTGSHTTKGNIFEDLGFSKEESLALKLKINLYEKLISLINEQEYSSKDLEKILDQPQPRISELLNGKISKISIEKIVDYLSRVGVKEIETSVDTEDVA